MVGKVSSSVAKKSSAIIDSASANATLLDKYIKSSNKDVSKLLVRRDKKTGKLKRINPLYVGYNKKTNKTIKTTDPDIFRKELGLRKNANIENLIKKGSKSKSGFNILRFKKPEDFKGFNKKSKPPSLNLQSEKTYKKFGHKSQFYELDLGLNNTNINDGLSYAINEKIKGVGKKDKIRVIIETDQGYISSKLLSKEDFEAQYLNDTGNYDFDEMIEDTNFGGSVSNGASVSIQISSGAVAGRGKVINRNSNMYQKKSILPIKNDDDLCLGRCLVCHIAARDKHPKKQQIREGRKIQTELTHELYNKAGIEPEIATLDTIRQFEKYLDCSITIIDGNEFNNVIYPCVDSDDYEVKDENIYLYKIGNHYDLINSNKIAGFFAKTYFCHKCKKTHTSQKHKCIYKCNICSRGDCDCIGIDFSEKREWFPCKRCNRNFPSQMCFNNHKTAFGKSACACDTIYKCFDTGKLLYEDKQPRATHKAGDFVCGNCKCVCNEKTHKCYMMPKQYKQPSEKYIYFDFECDIISADNHVVNYGVAQYHNNINPDGEAEQESNCFESLEDFCDWAFQEKHNHYTFIAHNGRGYDFQLVMKWIYKNTSYKPFTIYAGSKIMTFSVSGELKLRFVDSLNFITQKLSSFPKTFGIKELKKGFYPYWFNSVDNFDYIGEMPERRFFKPNQMDEKSRKEFLKWYDDKKQNNYIWNHREETKTYCISDVDILRRSCEIFRDTYLEIADIDPFGYTTIASVCMAIFKGNYIVPHYNTNYWNIKESGDKDELTDFITRTTKQVFTDKKIAIFNYEDQEFIRKSFFGGRTNAIKLKYDFKDNEEGIYSDITSLYPSVNYYDEYPLGHPEIITENFGDVKNYFGFVDCDVVCPKDLYFPVLARKGEKLLFDLQDKRGVWATNELNKAIEKGYKIKKIHKVFHFQKTSRELFKPYVSKFLKIKQEASGFPDWCKTEDDKLKYIADYKEQQGIQLDYSKIKFNAGMRAIAKLCLNSLWGKFGQRSNMPKTEIISDKTKWNDIVFNDKYTSQSFFFIDDERVEISYKMTDDNVESNFNTNIAIASFTTASARMRLYYGLDKLNRQVLYHDTDSLVYVYDNDKPQGEGNEKLPLGDLLGEWTDELDGTKMIGTFISGGPKNYSYETDDGEYHTKIKGFTLNYDACKVLNHNNMINMVNQYSQSGEVDKLSVNYGMIQRNQDKELTNYNQTKQYGFCYDKRVILPETEDGTIDTLPIGYKIK